MGIIKEIRKAENLTEREVEIKEYILNHPEEILQATTRDLGAATLSSAAAVSRFCRKLGCENFSDFKQRFAASLQSGEIYEKSTEKEAGIRENENTARMSRKVEEVFLNSIQGTSRELSVEQMMRAVDALNKASFIGFYASGTNVHLCRYACSQFAHCGKAANTFEAVNAQELAALSAERQHAAILISHTGENRRLIRIATILKQKKVPVIAITRSKHSTLGKHADYVFVAESFTSDREDFAEMWSLKFTTSVKFILDTMFACLFSKNYEACMKLNESYEQLGKEFWNI